MVIEFSIYRTLEIIDRFDNAIQNIRVESFSGELERNDNLSID